MNKGTRTVLLFAALLMASPLWAGPLLVLTAGGGGRVAFGNTNPSPLVGNQINISQLAAGTLKLPIFDGRMFFNAANSGSRDYGNVSAKGQQLFITGCVGGAVKAHGKGGCGDGGISGLLITAQLLDPHLVEKNGQTLLVAEVLEHVDPKLAAMLKLPATTYEAELQLQLLQVRDGPRVHDLVEGGFLETVNGFHSTIPEPPSIVLLGVPLVWFAIKRRVLRAN